MLVNIFSYIIIFVECFCYTIVLNSAFPRKNIFKQHKHLDFLLHNLILVSLFWIMLICPVFDNLIPLKPLLVMVIYVLAGCVFYYSKPLILFFISAMYYITVHIIDYFTMLIFGNYLKVNLETILAQDSYFIIAAAFSKSFLFLIILLYRKGIDMKRNSEIMQQISHHYWFVLVIQSFVTMISLFAILELGGDSTSLPLVIFIAATGLLFLNIATFWLLDAAAHFTTEARENTVVKQQNELALDNIKVLSLAFSNQKHHIHDYKQNISTIYQLLESQKYTRAINYIKTLSNELYAAIYRINTKHDIIDAILNQKDIQALQNGIELDVRTQDLSMVKIQDNLLIIIIANIIENAIEACSLTESEKIISVKLIIESGTLIFSVINPVSTPVEIKDKTIATTKEDKSLHGYGLKSVSAAIKQCNGDFEMECKNNKFQFTALILLEQQ